MAKDAAKKSVLYILDILQKYTDESHPKSAKEIQEIMANYPYELEMHRDSIKATLEVIQECSASDTICCRRTDQEGEDRFGGYTHGWYYNKPIKDQEINDLINAVLYSQMMSDDIAFDYQKKLKTLMSPSYQLQYDQLNAANRLPSKQTTVREETFQLFNQLLYIIQKNKQDKNFETQVSFYFNKYVVYEGKVQFMHKERMPKQKVLPLAIAEYNHNRYLIAYKEKEKHLWHYRLDLISEFEVLENCHKSNNAEKRKLLSQVSSEKKLAQYTKEHLFMFYESEEAGYGYYKIDNSIQPITLKIDDYWKGGVTFLVDHFGKDVKIVKDNMSKMEYKDCEEIVGSFQVEVNCTPTAILEFVKHYLDRVEVVKPAKVRRFVREQLRSQLEKAMNDHTR